jgi:hypothetical protein
MRAIRIDPQQTTVDAIEFPDELNTPLDMILDAPSHEELDAGPDHVLIVRRGWHDDTHPNFVLGVQEQIAGTALLVGKTDQGAWTDATANVDDLKAQITWLDPILRS